MDGWLWLCGGVCVCEWMGVCACGVCTYASTIPRVRDLCVEQNIIATTMERGNWRNLLEDETTTDISSPKYTKPVLVTAVASNLS